ncbi:hypothetical protein [Kamptonema sp. UHCC 0994]|uniref:hypothetical protein n=1 Tax=Kamptonema sp. UHCC 0994 TaxID=3031329 RepID=UPI0023BB0D4F|nr:hypothetical protein [Kamptonema sp. UHCC 0994]MDF0556381.1 hypothetical protein [Kamptonema sp. UHCC 0994]
MTSQICPICKASINSFPRYPKYVCEDCFKKATDINGRKLNFYNESMGGGYVAYYSDSNNAEEYNSHESYIDGIKCWADEARFGGIVIEVVE